MAWSGWPEGQGGDAVSDLETRIAKALEADAYDSRSEHQFVGRARALLPEAAKEHRPRTRLLDLTEAQATEMAQLRAELKEQTALRQVAQAKASVALDHVRGALAALTSREKETGE